MNRADQNISVQLYSVRDELKHDPVVTLRRLRAIGYTTVEPFDLTASAPTLARQLRTEGLLAPTAHERFVGRDLDAVLDAAQLVGVTTVIDPKVAESQWQKKADIDWIAEQLNLAAEAAAARGLQVGYHNHRHELTTKVGSETALAYLARQLDERVKLELDVYWIAVAGEDPLQIVGDLADKTIALHLKDAVVPSIEAPQIPLGQGALPTEGILALAPGAIRVVEVDRTDGNVFDLARASYNYLTDRVAV